MPAHKYDSDHQKIVYLYGFTRYAGHDRVCVAYESLQTDKKKKLTQGDLLQHGGEYFLVLWTDVSFVEQYEYDFPWLIEECEILIRGLLTEHTLQFVHRMVYTRYSSYKNIVPLFINHDIPALLAKKWSAKLLQRIKSHGEWKQTLVVCPDVWTIESLLRWSTYDRDTVTMLHSASTQQQKDRFFWYARSSKELTLVCTSSELFANRMWLGRIVLHDPTKWYYANQQEPRYKVVDCVKQLATLWWIDVEYEGVQQKFTEEMSPQM